MAGHSKFKNIMHRKGAQDKKRAKLFSRLIREISVATKLGLPDPDSNPRLRTAINNGLAANMPKENIDRAIRKNSGSSSGNNIDEIVYEGFGAGGAAIIIDAITDNKNRTASEIRTTFNKNNGNLGNSGSVKHFFDRVGVIKYPKNIGSYEDIFEFSLEIDAKDVAEDDESYEVITDLESYNLINSKLEKKYNIPISSNLDWKPRDLINVSEKDSINLIRLIEKLEEVDDVQNISSNFDIKEEIMEKIF